MNFPYRATIAEPEDDGDFLLFLRPEISVTVRGPTGSEAFFGLVDTGSDHTILPLSVAELLDIPIAPAAGPPATVFGGNKVQLMLGQADLEIEADGESLAWRAPLCFFDFGGAEETLVLGHAGFLDYFTATFDGQHGVLTLIPNDDLPRLV
jgi:hypothetical protein